MGRQIRQSDILRMYADEFYFRFDITPQVTLKERMLLSKLIKEFGLQGTNDLILNTMKYWKGIKSRKRQIMGFPNIGFIWGWRYYLADFLKEKNGTKKRKITESGGSNIEARNYFNS